MLHRRPAESCPRAGGVGLRRGLRLRLAIGLGLGENFNVSDPGIELDDGVCDFEKVPPDQL